MGYSSLVSYINLSPNRTSPRNNKIDTITIHCMAGNLSIETCGRLFANYNTQASSNYGIGSDGRIGLYVDENNRSWCTSSPSNDNRAITIEVANDGGAPDWHVSDKALQSLTKLCVDICKRNAIKKLVWSNDKYTRMNHLDGCNMTVHRDYANKACPGDYLYRLQQQIADDVNKAMNSDLRYRVHQQTYGWLPWVYEGECAGYTGRSKRAESIILESTKVGLMYMVHQQTYGDSQWFTNGQQAGVTGQSKRLEGFAVKCTTKGKKIRYKGHIQGIGWTDWCYNGEFCGTRGQSRRLEAIIIEFC